MADTAEQFLNKYVTAFASKIKATHCADAGLFLLSAIFLTLNDIKNASNFGLTKFEINPVALDTIPVKILVVDTQGRVRKVSVWIDSASGGPAPTIRIGKAATSSNGGGIRVIAGQVNELGEVPPDVELWGASSTAINAYIIERA